MLILSKKRIMLALCVMCIILYAFSLKNTNNINENGRLNKITEKNSQTVSATLSDKVVIVDAGHGSPDERSRRSKWHYRSTVKFKNCIKITKNT